MKKPLNTKTWKQPKRGIEWDEHVRAAINSSKENFSIDVQYFNPADALGTKPAFIREKATIEIEFPNGQIWSGDIEQLQQLLNK